MLGAEEDASRIDGHQRVPICHTGCQNGAANAIAGIGNDNVDPTEAFRCLGCLRDHGGLVGDISDRRQVADVGGARFSHPDAATAPVIIAVLSLKRILRLPLRFAETILQKPLQSVDTFVLNLERHLEAKVNNTPSVEERPKSIRRCPWSSTWKAGGRDPQSHRARGAGFRGNPSPLGRPPRTADANVCPKCESTMKTTRSAG